MIITSTSCALLRRVLGVAACLAATTVLLSAYRADPAQVKQLRETKRCEGCNLQDADLRGTFLDGAHLKNADLRGAKLYKATLRQADLTDANLYGADLSGADLRGVRGLNLAGATTTAQTRCVDGSAGPCANR